MICNPIMTKEEIEEGDKFFIDSQVQYNRAIAGGGYPILSHSKDITWDKVKWHFPKMVNEPGEIIAFGYDYIKVKTTKGNVCVPWYLTGTCDSDHSYIYDFIAIGVPVIVNADRVFDKAYCWTATDISLDIGQTDKYSHKDFNSKYFNEQHLAIWSDFEKVTDHEVSKFIGKNGSNLRDLLERNNLSQTTITFENYGDNLKLISITTPYNCQQKVMDLISDNLYTKRLFI